MTISLASARQHTPDRGPHVTRLAARREVDGQRHQQQADGGNDSHFHFPFSEVARVAAHVCTNSRLIPVPVVFVGVSSCVQYSADRLRAPEGSTDRNCSAFPLRNYLNENNPKGRTEMSVASTATESASPISPASHGHTKPNSTLRTSLASILGRVGAGLLATMSRPPKRSASSSAKSCDGFTNEIKRRPF